VSVAIDAIALAWIIKARSEQILKVPTYFVGEGFHEIGEAGAEKVRSLFTALDYACCDGGGCRPEVIALLERTNIQQLGVHLLPARKLTMAKSSKVCGISGADQFAMALSGTVSD
jgi:hypothetical protein